jgi:hypothetical protein
MLVRTVDVSKGMGSSGLVDVPPRRGRKGLYGSGCAERVFDSAGIPVNYCQPSIGYYQNIDPTIDQVPK